jgi:superfamily II DNA/RNA helicase
MERRRKDYKKKIKIYKKKKQIYIERDEKLKLIAHLLSSTGKRRCLIHLSTSRRLSDISALLEGRTINSCQVMISQTNDILVYL